MEKILLAHGSGGRQSQELIQKLIYPIFNNNGGQPLLDGAILPSQPGRIAVSTDSFVVSPLTFPGGDIGKLAVCGTVNDLVCMGATPKYLTVGLILEEGLPMAKLETILRSMAAAAQEAQVQIVTGDTKVVERGNADGIYINTSGVGFVPDGVNLGPQHIETGDLILVTGTMGDHGMAIMSKREGLAFGNPIASDCAPLNKLIAPLLQYSQEISCLRDPTRGGLATTLNELAQEGNALLEIREEAIPIDPTVQSACDMLGLDPLYLANEGKLIIILKPQAAEKTLALLGQSPYGGKAAIIGKVINQGQRGQVLLETTLGAKRLLAMLEGEHLPRIC